MTLFAFKKRYKQQRRAAAPLPPDFIQVQEKKTISLKNLPLNRPRVWITATASVAAAALLITALMTTDWLGASVPVNPESQATTSTTNGQTTMPTTPTTTIPIDSRIPSWYTPKKITVRALTYFGSAIPTTTAYADTAVGMNYLQIKRNPGEETDFIYVDVEAKKTVNVNTLIRPILQKNKLENGSTEYYVLSYSAVKKSALITYRESGNVYYVDTALESCRKLSKFKFNYGRQLASSADYTRFVQRGKGVLYYDLTKDTVIDITRDASGKQIYASDDDTDDAYFSPTGRYILFSTRDRQGGLAHGLAGCYVLYDCDTGKSTIVDGEIDHFTANDEYLIAEQDSGGYKLRCETMTREAITAENTEAKDRIRMEETMSARLGENYLTLYDLATAAVHDVSDKPVAAYVFSPDHRYLYYYIKGEKVITCMDVTTKQAFTMDVDAGFVGEVSALEKDGAYVAKLSLYYDEQKQELLLCYSQQPNTSGEIMELSPVNFIQYGANLYYTMLSNPYTPRYLPYLTFYEGKGYMYCVAQYNGEVLVAFEDARNNSMSYYRHQGSTMQAPVEFLNCRSTKANLSGLKTVLQQRKIAIHSAKTDYNALKLDGRLDPLKDGLIYQDLDRFLPCLSDYYVMKFPQEGAYCFNSTFDEAELRRILELAMKLPRYYFGYKEGLKTVYKICLQAKEEYRNVVPVSDIHIGTYKGKPFLEYGSYQGEISQADYQWLATWCENWRAANTFTPDWE